MGRTVGIFKRRRSSKDAQAQKALADEPPGIRSYLLLGLSGAASELSDIERYMREADKIDDKMVKRNLRGIELEKKGKVDQAVKLYEQNVAEWFPGNHPYNRLRIIYTKRKQYDDAIRVCQRFVDVADRLVELGSPRSDLAPKRERFLGWIVKLESRAA